MLSGGEGGETCGAPVLGTCRMAGMAWSDKGAAFLFGPVTGVRIWLTIARPNLWVNLIMSWNFSD